jgi:hypothetical protein
MEGTVTKNSLRFAILWGGGSRSRRVTPQGLVTR